MTRPSLPDDLWTIAQLMTRGLTDHAVAHHEGVGVKTVRRRIATLIDALEANTRFEAGYKLRDLEERIVESPSTETASPRKGEGEPTAELRERS